MLRKLFQLLFCLLLVQIMTAPVKGDETDDTATYVAPSLVIDAGHKNYVAPVLSFSGGHFVRTAPVLTVNAGFFTRFAPELILHVNNQSEVVDDEEEEAEEEIEEEEVVEEEAEEEIEEEEVVEEEAEEEIEEEIVDFIAELVSAYKAQRVEEFGDLVSNDYREMRRSDEDRETLDYDALIAAMSHEADLVDALRIKHTILGVGSRNENVRVRIRWKMRFRVIESGRKMTRKGLTELVLVDQGQLQLITQRRDPLFGSITSDSLEGDVTEKPTRPKRKRDRPRGRN